MSTQNQIHKSQDWKGQLVILLSFFNQALQRSKRADLGENYHRLQLSQDPICRLPSKWGLKWRM